MAVVAACSDPGEAPQAAPPPSTRPNFVLILTDDQGWSHLSSPMDPAIESSGSSYLETPNLDRLMAEGMRFTNAYSAAPLCTPSRRSILNGTSAARSGTEFLHPTWTPAEHVTIPTALRAVDPEYRCGHFGKWGAGMRSTPAECGYESGDGVTVNATGQPNLEKLLAGRALTEVDALFDEEDPKRTNGTFHGARQFLREQAAANAPFFVQISTYALHLPSVCREETARRFASKGEPDRNYSPAYAAMLFELDAAVGLLLEELDALGLRDETFVFLTSDNGGALARPIDAAASRGDVPTNAPLTGRKLQLYEGGIRVPFIVRGPGVLPGSVCPEPVCGYDLLPTVHDLAGADTPLAAPDLDGSSLLALLLGRANSLPPRSLFFHRPARLASAVRAGPFKLLVRWRKSGKLARTELYRVDVDPTESAERDLTAKEPDRTRAMLNSLYEHLEEVDSQSIQELLEKEQARKERRERVRNGR